MAFLESEASVAGKYFRSIEFGTKGFIGKELVVLPDRIVNALGTPSDLRDALAYLNATGGKLGRGRFVTTVKHEIEPKDAYERAFASFDPAARELDAIKQAFSNAGISSSDAKGRSRVSAASRSSFLSNNLRGRFISGSVLSQRSLSLAKIDSQFRAELTVANRILAEALAGEVALVYKESLKRPEQSTGKLVESTLDSRNRFPV